MRRSIRHSGTQIGPIHIGAQVLTANGATGFTIQIDAEAFAKALPLWHGVELMRHLAVGYLSWPTVGHSLYFVAMTIFGVWFTTVRLRVLFLR